MRRNRFISFPPALDRRREHLDEGEDRRRRVDGHNRTRDGGKRQIGEAPFGEKDQPLPGLRPGQII